MTAVTDVSAGWHDLQPQHADLGPGVDLAVQQVQRARVLAAPFGAERQRSCDPTRCCLRVAVIARVVQQLRAGAGRDRGDRRLAADNDRSLDQLGAPDQFEGIRRHRRGQLHALGRPLYVSLSRKDLIAALLAGSWADRLPAAERGNGTIAAAALAAAKGAHIHRLHDFEALEAVRVAARIAADAAGR